jgi:peptide/nickel transport system ATP-binding protein
VEEAARRAQLNEDILHMPDGFDTYVGERGTRLSGGQRQRVSIARIFLKDPQILILDEATSALDVTVQKQIVELLMKLQKERKLSYLFICHNLALVQMFCDRVMVLYDGRIVEQGTPEDVILHPKSEYAGRLVNAIF